MSPQVQITQTNSVIKLFLNRPEQRNALSLELLKELGSSLEKIRRTAEIRTVVLGSTGDNFCSGADLKFLVSNKSRQAREEFFSALSNVLNAMHKLPQTIICVVKGYALAGGLGLVAASDLVLTDSQARFGLPELKVGLVPIVIMPHLLRSVGPNWTKYLCLSANIIDATQAKEIGLVHELLESSKLDSRVNELTSQLLHLAPRTARKTKETLRTITKPGATKGAPKAGAAWSLLDEASEGFNAVLEKRLPKWAKIQSE